jgi:DNA-binding response OmpR family regulator
VPSLFVYPEDSYFSPIVMRYAKQRGFTWQPDADLTVLDASRSMPSVTVHHALKIGGTGADLSLPVTLPQLFQAIEARLPKPEITLGSAEFSPTHRTLTSPNKTTDLTDKETALLLALYEAKEQGVSNDILLSTIWGYQEGIDTHTLQTHIYRLRQKLEGIEIITQEGGYRLEGNF